MVTITKWHNTPDFTGFDEITTNFKGDLPVCIIEYQPKNAKNKTRWRLYDILVGSQANYGSKRVQRGEQLIDASDTLENLKRVERQFYNKYNFRERRGYIEFNEMKVKNKEGDIIADGYFPIEDWMVSPH